MVFFKPPGLVGKTCPAFALLVGLKIGWSAMMEVINDELDDLRYFLERRLEHTFDTMTRVYGRPEVLLDNVPDVTFLLVDCCVELTGFCVELIKLTEVVLQDLLNVAIWFGS